MGLGGLNNTNIKGKKVKKDKNVDPNKPKTIIDKSGPKIVTKSNNSAANRSMGSQRGS